MQQAKLFWDRIDVFDDLNTTGLDGWMDSAAKLTSKFFGDLNNNVESSYNLDDNGKNV